MASRALVLFVLLSLALPASALSQDGEKLRATRTFRCLFTASASGNLDGEAPTAQIDRDTLELVFDQIDSRARTGRLIGNEGGADVSVISSSEATTILEPLGSGLIHMTAIYLAQTKDGRFKAVHSRHSALFGGVPIPSQFYGSCRALL